MKKGRRLWILPSIAAILTLPCGASVFGEPIPPEATTLETLQPVFDREIAIYRDANLREQETGIARLGDTLEVQLEGGQCVGVVAASVAPWPAQVRLFAGGEPLAHSDRTHVASVAWCDPFASRVVILFDADWQSYLAPSAQSREGTVHYRVLMGRTDAFDLRSLPRGQPSEQRLRATLSRLEADRAAIAERANLPSAEAVLDPVRVVSDAGALLVPRSSATWDSLRAAMTRYTAVAPTALVPRVHEASIGPENYVSYVTTTLPLVRDGDELRRVLAVVDPADLPVDGRVPCTTIRFGRLATDASFEVHRFDLRSSERLASAGVAASDTFCPTDPPRLYLVPATDQYEYVVRFFVAEGPSAPRHPSQPLEAPIYPDFVEALQSCRTRGERCIDAAREARDGAHVPVDEPLARDLLRRACAADSTDCPEYAEHLLSMHDQDSTAVEVLERACNESSWDACARFADLLRLGRGIDADYPRAVRAYRRACEHDIQEACDNADAMELLKLTAEESDESEDSDLDDSEPDDSDLDSEPDDSDLDSELDDSDLDESEPNSEDPAGITADQ